MPQIFKFLVFLGKNTIPILALQARALSFIKLFLFLILGLSIFEFTEFEKGKLVCIVEETHHKFLAVGKSMVSSLELENMEKGEVIQNTHYISDKFWETGKTIYD